MAEKYFGEATGKLGFGLMRLPHLANGEFDIDQIKQMVDLFMEAGLTYFDTAYAYTGSEEATRKALVERYPRDSYTLASKLNAWLPGIKDEKMAKDELDTSLKRAGVDYFDYYLLHAFQPATYHLYDDYGLWDFVAEAKKAGKVKHVGFSFHATPAVLEERLSAHPEMEFIQLQINYADWDNPAVAARECYEIARRHGKSIVVMEPVKGGMLANPPKKVQEIFKAANPDASFASWAIRYAASMEGIITVLSGMSNLAQMEDNLSYMRDFKPLSAEEMKVIEAVQAELRKSNSIPCTACEYCMPGCPMNIPIPKVFRARNRQIEFEEIENGKKDYDMEVKELGKASDCIACGQCESACPQHIDIIDRLKECAEVFD